MTIAIYHNPNCGASRNMLAMIRRSGEERVVIEYLKTPIPAGVPGPSIHTFACRLALLRKNQISLS